MSSMTSPLFGADNSGPSASSVNYNRVNATFPSSWTGTEAQRTIVLGGPCTISHLYMQVDIAPGAGTSYTFTVMKNGSATAVAVTIADGATSGTDAVNSVSFSAGDTISIRCTPTNTPASNNNQYWNLQVTTNDLTAPILSGMGATSTSAVNYGSLTAGTASVSSWSVAEADMQIIVPTNGVLSKLYARISSTPGSGKSYNFTLMKNGVATALDATISDTNSAASNTAQSVSVAPGDTITIRSTPTGTPTSQPSISFGMVFTPAVPGETFFGFGSSFLPSTTAANYEQVMGIGNLGWVGNEGNRQMVFGPYMLRSLYVKLVTAPGGAATRTFTMRKNNANTALAVTLTGAAATGNITNDVTYSQGDIITIGSTTASTPAAATGGVHTGVLVYATPVITAPDPFTPVIMIY